MAANNKRFRELALMLPESEEKSHFGKADFRVRNKIFAGFSDEKRAYVKLTAEQQEMVCASETVLVQPIPGGWGKQGWTEIAHFEADQKLLESLLNMAWKNIAPKTLVAKHMKKDL
jgi:hypothetical protein